MFYPVVKVHLCHFWWWYVVGRHMGALPGDSAGNISYFGIILSYIIQNTIQQIQIQIQNTIQQIQIQRKIKIKKNTKIARAI